MAKETNKLKDLIKKRYGPEATRLYCDRCRLNKILIDKVVGKGMCEGCKKLMIVRRYRWLKKIIKK